MHWRQKAALDAAGYLLVAEAWPYSSEKPLPSHLAAPGEGLRLYPFDSPLILLAAETYTQEGYAADASALIYRELKFADDATVRRLETLRALRTTAR